MPHPNEVQLIEPGSKNGELTREGTKLLVKSYKLGASYAEALREQALRQEVFVQPSPK